MIGSGEIPGGGEFRVNPELERRRILTERDHFYYNRNPDGTYPVAVEQAVFVNLFAKVQEDTMSAAVTETFQPVAEVIDDTGRRKRTYMWLGFTALQVAESGYKYVASPVGFDRVHYAEVPEAKRSESHAKAGVTQSMISPKIAPKEASRAIALAEHMADTDAVRTATIVKDKDGNIIGRNTKALLVRDIPLQAWVDMLRDPNNIWGKSIPVEDEESALSVMKVFPQLDMPDEALPEGPVTLVAVAMNYIKDEKAKASVARQVAKFRGDQDFLKAEAEIVTRKWVKFEKAMSDSKHAGTMHPDVHKFVIQLQSEWPDDVLELLRQNQTSGGGYSMSEELAARIELGWQKANLGNTAFIVGDERALKNVDQKTITRIQEDNKFIRLMEAAGASRAEIAAREAELGRVVAVSGVKPGSGCSGTNEFEFSSKLQFFSPKEQLAAELKAPTALAQDQNNSNDSESKIGKKKMAVCRTDGCPSRPGETMVGGCDVCLKHCQKLFDQNLDPAKIYGNSAEPAKNEEPVVKIEFFSSSTKEDEVSSRQRADEKRLADEAERYLIVMSGKTALQGVS